VDRGVVTADQGDTPKSPQIDQAVSEASVPKRQKAGAGISEADNLDPRAGLTRSLERARFIVQKLSDGSWQACLPAAVKLEAELSQAVELTRGWGQAEASPAASPADGRADRRPD
jgi:hypothetical protein